MKKLWSSSPVLFLREALLLYFSRRVPQAAASLAYFVLLTVFPVLICVSYLLGLVNIDVVSLIDQLQTVFPPERNAGIICGDGDTWNGQQPFLFHPGQCLRRIKVRCDDTIKMILNDIIGECISKPRIRIINR